MECNRMSRSAKTAIDAYDAALSLAKEGGKASIGAKKCRRQELLAILTNLTLDLMKTADGNEEMLLTTGYQLSKTPQPLPPLNTPEIKKIEAGDSIGELVVSVKSQAVVKAYMYEHARPSGHARTAHPSRQSSLILLAEKVLVPRRGFWKRRPRNG